ncbi:hypothetical protein ACOMHN_006145 [Nucella lapillus]
MAKLLLLLLFLATARLSLCQTDFQSTEDAAEDPGERELVERALTSLEGLELRRELEDLQSDNSLAEAAKREEGVGFPGGEDQQTPRQSREEEMGFPANEERRSEGETDTSYQGSLPEDHVKTDLYRRLEELSEDVYRGVENGENINDDTDEPVGANPAKRGWRFSRRRRSGSRGGRKSGGWLKSILPAAGSAAMSMNPQANGAQHQPNYPSPPPHGGAYGGYPPQGGYYYPNPNMARPYGG